MVQLINERMQSFDPTSMASALECIPPEYVQLLLISPWLLLTLKFVPSASTERIARSKGTSAMSLLELRVSARYLRT